MKKTELERQKAEIEQQHIDLQNKYRQLAKEKDKLYGEKIDIQAQKKVVEMTVNELLDDKRKLREKEELLSANILKLEKLNNNLILWQRALLHEQKNMFTEIYNQIYHIKETPSDENLVRAIKKTEIIESEINNLLKWSRDFVKKTEPAYSNFDFKIVIDKFNDIYETYSGNKEIIIKPKIFRLYSDENLLRFIFYNLIKNVLNIVREDAKIQINIKKNNDKYVFEMKDNGPGFKGFKPGENIFNKVKKGTGLMIVKRCIEILKGSIELENMPSGGAKFKFCILAHSPDEKFM